MKNLDKRVEIMQSALKLIAENGFHGAPMATIAEEAGVAAGTIYLYFESKDVLIKELYNELEGKLIATLQEGYSTERSIRDRFIYLGTTLLRYHIDNPLQFRYIQQYHNSPYGVSLRRERFLGKNRRKQYFHRSFGAGDRTAGSEGFTSDGNFRSGFRSPVCPGSRPYPWFRRCRSDLGRAGRDGLLGGNQEIRDVNQRGTS